ncbi:uncharacterized protein METZ01_LOCUS293651, partial [marine metagenome]
MTNKTSCMFASDRRYLHSNIHAELDYDGGFYTI